MRRATVLLLLGALGCAGSPATSDGTDGGLDATTPRGAGAAGSGPGAEPVDGAVQAEAGLTEEGGADAGTDAASCATRITYGGAWIHGASHPDSFDVAPGVVTWDGVCTDDGTSSYAVLSNGWKPYFTGHSACVVALDAQGCGAAPSCATRITYGASWQRAAGHSLDYDDVADRVVWDGLCTDSGGGSYATLSNGFVPHFNGSGACALSLRYTGCGGLYTNPVLPVGCADPGVLHDGARWVVTCTSGNAPNAFPIRTSPDLIHWSDAGDIFPSASKPTWAKGDFWAPEIHKVGAGYVAYFTARHTDGQLSIGAAKATSPLGPFVDVGAPVVHEAAMGVIDATYVETAAGARYLVWKDDGNALGKPTPIHARALAADGVTLTGADTVLLTNDQPWEGAVTEGPWMIAHGGEYFLFYSGASYANASYAVGVARGPSPLGPFTKAPGPIVATKGAWVGPGHCSVVDAPSGDTAIVYHAWAAGHVNGPGDARLLLVDRIAWGSDGWPTTIAPSTGTVAVP